MMKMRATRLRLGAVCTSAVLVTAVLAQVGAGAANPVNAAGSGANIAYVAGNSVPPPGDRPNVDQLEAMGAHVTIVDDDTARGTDYSGFDLIFLSTSVTLSKVGDHFETVAIPIVTNEQYLLDDNTMGSKPIGKINTKRIRIAEPGHELAAGLTGLVKFTTAKTPLGYATPGPGAEVIARYQGRDVFFVYRTDAEMIDGATAPARRVFFPGAYRTPTKANATYFDLFDAAIGWALTSDNQPPIAIDDAGFTDEDTVLNGGPDATLLAAFGGRGTEPGQFAFPQGVAVDGDDNIVVADTRNHRVQICTPVGDCSTFGSRGTGLGQFEYPSDVAVDGDGNIIVADTENHRVQICTPSGDCTAFGSQGEGPGLFQWPVGVAADNDGNIIVVDGNAHWVQTCSPTGDCTTFGEIGSELGQFISPNGVAVDGDGNIVVAEADNDRIQICSPTGDCSTFGSSGSAPGELRSPWDVDVDADGNFIIGDEDNNRVQICSPTWDCVAFGGDGPGPGGSELGEFSAPFGVAADSHGNVVVADGGNDRVQVFAPGGVLANDTDPDADPLSVTAFDAVSVHGAAVDVHPDGTYTYDPTAAAALQALGAGDSIDDTFTYTVGDGRGGVATATVTVTVAGLDE